ncbi:unnamed protein product [Parascedosporium putredinis]|uniref:Tyrosine phosphatase n=1 Tax=Parascedosporium putredinis TaxID=1442378 RepID=A0A9P1H716_9PEZI|nr:unnamed protein product [Parascedosporium putredinis]CAI7999415.1 unnamed protein product [Parascedosporium putredinis]
MDSLTEPQLVDFHTIKQTATTQPSTHILQLDGQVVYNEVAVSLEESDGQKSVDNSTAPSQSESVTPVSVLDGRLANFGVVTPGIYRSAWPTVDTYDFVKSLNLKTVVTLVRRDVEDEAYAALLQVNGIKHHTILRLVLDKSNHPVLIHCNHGRHRTGCAVGAIRKVYGWDTTTVVSEYQSFAYPKPRESDISYVTSIEPSLFFQEPSTISTLPRREAFLRTLFFTFIGALIWLSTGFKFDNNRPHQ